MAKPKDAISSCTMREIKARQSAGETLNNILIPGLYLSDIEITITGREPNGTDYRKRRIKMRYECCGKEVWRLLRSIFLSPKKHSGALKCQSCAQRHSHGAKHQDRMVTPDMANGMDLVNKCWRPPPSVVNRSTRPKPSEL